MFSRISTAFISLALLAALAPVKSAPTFLTARHEGHDDAATGTASTTTSSAPAFVKQNGLDAQKLNSQFPTIKPTDSCQAGQMACISDGFAQCVAGKWEITACSAGLKCVALPLVNKPGTSLVCDTTADALSRFEAAGVSGGLTGTDATASGSPDGGVESEDDGDDDCTEEGSDGIDDDDADIPDCDDEDAFTTIASSTSTKSTSTSTTSSSSAPTLANQANNGGTTLILNTMTAGAAPTDTPSTIIKLNRRQITTLATLPPATVTPDAATVAASSAVATPTVIIGTNGIVTVTVVSTVTVSATDCAATAASPIPTPISVSSALPAASSAAPSSINPSSSFSLPGSTNIPVATPVSSTTISTSVPTSTSAPIIQLTSSVLPAATSTAINNQGGGFGGFGFPAFSSPATTPSPIATFNPATINISDLLTATVTGS